MDTSESVSFTECSFWVRAYGVPFHCFSGSTAEIIVKMIGGFEHLASDDAIRWTKALHFRVSIPLDKPLHKGGLLWIGSREVHWIQLHHERLPKFCYSFGLMGHAHQDCLSMKTIGNFQYRDWL